MKHLKTYKLFEADYFDLSPEERRVNAADRFDYLVDAPVMSTLKDISLELEDGFDVSISHSTASESIPFVKIKIYKKRGGYFNFTKEIQEYLLRVYQFMRELGWYSKLEYKQGLSMGGVTKKFYIRPDERMRTQDIQWIDDKWPSVGSIEMTWSSSYNSMELEKDIKEGLTRTRDDRYMNIVHEMESDLEVINDMLLEISDLGYHTYASLSPMTHFAIENPDYIDTKTHTWSKSPEMFIDIKQNPKVQTGHEWGGFYGNLGQHRELIDSAIERILSYLEERGYKLKFTYDNREGKPSEFEFINNPTSYQMQFTK